MDVNFDGKVDLVDVLRLLKMATGVEITWALEAAHISTALVSTNGKALYEINNPEDTASGDNYKIVSPKLSGKSNKKSPSATRSGF